MLQYEMLCIPILATVFQRLSLLLVFSAFFLAVLLVRLFPPNLLCEVLVEDFGVSDFVA